VIWRHGRALGYPRGFPSASEAGVHLTRSELAVVAPDGARNGSEHLLITGAPSAAIA
jgi:hypothetical protein